LIFEKIEHISRKFLIYFSGYCGYLWFRLSSWKHHFLQLYREHTVMRMQRKMSLMGLMGVLTLVGCGAGEESMLAEQLVQSSEETGAVEQANTWCQCTNYVNNRFALGGGFPNAQDWGPYLSARGYRQVSTPQVGDIVIYTAARMGNTAGHVAVIAGVSSTSITNRGANQLSTWATTTEFGCTNVSQGAYTRRTTGETYWRK
jgi:surface antigen